MEGWATRRHARQGAIVVAVIALTTPVVAILEVVLGLPDASSAYLVAVVLSGMTAGTGAALATAAGAILTYDLLFTEPFMTPVITDTSEWLSLVLFAFVGISVGQLVAMQRRRTREALTSEQEAQDLYAVTRLLATGATTAGALADIATVLTERAGLERVWFAIGEDEASERTVADSGHGPTPAGGTFGQLRRVGGGPDTEWVQLHAPMTGRGGGRSDSVRLRVPVEAGGARLGSLWAAQRRSAVPLDPTTTRLLAVVADQVGQAIRQDSLGAAVAEARIARESSALKSALVESVSHDLRTPLASIRATAGTLMDRDVPLDPEELRVAAAAIDRQAERLDRLVANLLDLGRIQGGTLQAAREAVELRELVGRALARLTEAGRAVAERRQVEIEMEEVWVDADPVLLEQAVLNLLENAFRHTPATARVRVRATPTDDGLAVHLRVEDSGPGVPSEALPGLLERRSRQRSRTLERAESGLGLTIVRGFVEAMGGRVSADRSELGGLAIDLELVATHLPADLAVTR